MKKKTRLDKSGKDGYLGGKETDMLKHEWDPEEGKRERPEWLWRYIMALPYDRTA